MDDKNKSLNGFDSVEGYVPENSPVQPETAQAKPEASTGEYHYTASGIVQDAVHPAGQQAASAQQADPYAAQSAAQSADPQAAQNSAQEQSSAYGAGYVTQQPYYTQGAAGPQNAAPYSAYRPAGQADTGYGRYPHRPEQPAHKAKREKRRFGGAAVVAIALCCALLGGAASSLVTTRLIQNKDTGSVSSQSNSGNTTATTINVEETEASNVVEAVAEKVTPSVVGVRTTANVQINPFFGSGQESTGEGSGIIYSADGYILTNYHVIEAAAESRTSDAKVEVFLPSDPETAISAEIVGYDSTADLAVLKIDKRGLPAIELGDSDSLKVGERAIAVGNPGGLQFMGSVSAGYISGLNRTLQLDNAVSLTLIQTDAAINPGNSGGPLVNSQGQLIGINSAKMASDGFEGMGFAIPVNTAVEICNNIITNKDTPKPYIGIEVSTRYDADTLERMGYPAGALVSGITSGGPAEAAGLERGDLITKIDDTDITGYADLSATISKHKVGDTIKLTVYRSGKYYSVNVTLDASNG